VHDRRGPEAEEKFSSKILPPYQLIAISPGSAPKTLGKDRITAFESRPLRLSPRVEKRTGTTQFGGIHQARSRGVLVDQNRSPFYYASHVNPAYYSFVRTNRLYTRRGYEAAADNLNCGATISFPHRIDSQFLLPNYNRCLIGMLPNPGSERWKAVQSGSFRRS
jgi:hypothetical protein